MKEKHSAPRRAGAAVVARSAFATFAVIATIVSIGCASLETYSIRQAEDCGAASVCEVYGPNGQSLSPCVWTNRQAIYPGDPRWPYTTPGVCNGVRDGKVISTRELSPSSESNSPTAPPRS
jgi:hypothetical protein